MSLVFVAWLVTQGVAPLRKSDLVRLLSGSVMSQQEIAQLVSRNCLTFTPTDRDRSDFRRLGAEDPVLAAMDGCARRATHARPAPARPVATRPAATPTPIPTLTPTPPPSTPSPTVRTPPPPPARVSADRSGFVAGGGQSGPAGLRLPRALVFEARDTAGAPLAGQLVTFTGINARIEPESLRTDGDARARVGVTLGQRAGSAIVLAVAGDVEKQAAFRVSVGAVAQLVVACGAAELAGRVVLRPDTVAVLGVSARDAYGNPARLAGLRAAVADARILRVQRITEDSVVGSVALKPDQAGTTSLAVIANGLRQYVTVTVPPRAAPGKTDCP